MKNRKDEVALFYEYIKEFKRTHKQDWYKMAQLFFSFRTQLELERLNAK